MAKKAESIIPIFQLKAVELSELSITRPPIGAPSTVNFSFEVSVTSNVDNNQKFVITSTTVNIKGDDQFTVLGSIICACIFSVANLEELVKIKGDGQVELNDSFAETINSISISTTRGVMFSELKGTVLHYAFLPIIDIKSLSKS